MIMKTTITYNESELLSKYIEELRNKKSNDPCYNCGQCKASCTGCPPKKYYEEKMNKYKNQLNDVINNEVIQKYINYTLKVEKLEADALNAKIIADNAKKELDQIKKQIIIDLSK